MRQKKELGNGTFDTNSQYRPVTINATCVYRGTNVNERHDGNTRGGTEEAVPSLEVREGEVLGLIGRNGVGKRRF